jgi:hypothetical protein
MIALLSHDLGPKGFYTRRNKSGLEGMTQMWTLIGATEGALLGVVAKIKI